MNKTTNHSRVFRRGEAGFEQAVLGTSFTVRDPGRRPDIVVQANDVYEVMAAVRQAAQDNMHIGMCSGGHSWAQNHIREGGLVWYYTARQLRTAGMPAHRSDYVMMDASSQAVLQMDPRNAGASEVEATERPVSP